MRLRRIVTVDRPLDEVFAYLSDFTTTTQWDPGTVRTVLSHGDGGVGSEYQNTSTFAGRETQLTYVVQELVPSERISLRGENKTVIAHDTMTFKQVAGPQAGGRGDDEASAEGTRTEVTCTEVTYTADFTFKGIARLVAPFLGPAFERLGNEAEAGMASALAKL